MLSPKSQCKNTSVSNLRKKSPISDTEDKLPQKNSISCNKSFKCSIQEKMVYTFLTSMFSTIVEAWEPLPLLREISEDETDSEKKNANQNFIETVELGKQLKSSKSFDFKEDYMQPTSYQSPHQYSKPLKEERAIIRFRNGNTYEGCLCMQSMHGEGRFRWADGTVYEGHFENNEIKGRGTIHWKNDTWYNGEFLGNLRHGSGIYIDPRRQRAYLGDWHCAMKHGKGTMYYDHTFKNSYDGDWEKNIRHGHGIREYGPTSTYDGQWRFSLRDGEGLLIWPNHDIYKGQWKGGVMQGDGTYVWDAFYNNTFSLPSINIYRGQWERGERNGYGFLNLGLDINGYYKGEFKNNLKHGVGKFVSNNGIILLHKMLFKYDEFSPSEEFDTNILMPDDAQQYGINDINVSLSYHLEKVFKDLEKHEDINILNDYLDNNELLNRPTNRKLLGAESFIEDIQDRIEFEQSSLRKALQYYERDLRNIYYKYSTVLNENGIEFQPIMIRLFLWQMYFDCKILEKGLTLVDIDRLLHLNPEWLTGSAHNPFEKIYFWQFLHSLISVSRKLYAKKYISKYKPDTILASAFRKFMDEDILSGVFQGSGKLVNGYGECVPLKSLYALYRSIGEPHTIREFLCAARYPSHKEMPMQLINVMGHGTPVGRNVYEFEDELCYITESCTFDNTPKANCDLALFSFSNLSSKAIAQIFSYMYPHIIDVDKALDLTLEITFYEFFEAFILCAEESIKLNELLEENILSNKINQ